MSAVLEPPIAKIPTSVKHTPEELLALPHEGVFELIDGEFVEKAMSQESSWVAGVALRKLGSFVEDQNQLGWVFPADCGYECFGRNRSRVRKPDVSFVTREKMPERRFSSGHPKFAPDLAVEVISTHDIMEQVEIKIEEYLAAGTQSVWVIHPKARLIDIFRGDGSVVRLREADSLTEPKLLPGFVCQVKDLLPLPDEVPFGDTSDLEMK
jgi:Uma2 family endonuclease